MDRREAHDAAPDAVARAIAQSAPVVDERTRMAMRERVMRRVTNDAFVRRSRMMFRRAMAAATVAATLTGGVSYAAAISLPGDPLYGLKRASEELTLQLLPEGELKQQFLFTVATRRADEYARLSRGDADDALMSQTLEQFKLTTTAAFGGDVTNQEPTASEVRLNEHIDETPEPTQEQLKDALQSVTTPPAASQDAPAVMSAPADGGDQKHEPVAGDEGMTSTDTTGSTSPGKQ